MKISEFIQWDNNNISFDNCDYADSRDEEIDIIKKDKTSIAWNFMRNF